jgi:hypothetical protein
LGRHEPIEARTGVLAKRVNGLDVAADVFTHTPTHLEVNERTIAQEIFSRSPEP